MLVSVVMVVSKKSSRLKTDGPGGNDMCAFETAAIPEIASVFIADGTAVWKRDLRSKKPRQESLQTRERQLNCQNRPGLCFVWSFSCYGNCKLSGQHLSKVINIAGPVV